MTGCREMLKMPIFHTHIAIFGNFFFKKSTPSVFRNLKKLPWYQKSEKKTNEPFEWSLNLIEARGRGLQ